MRPLVFRAVLMIFYLAFVAGCATTAQQASPPGKPVSGGTGSTRELFLTMNGSQRDEPLVLTNAGRAQKGAPPAFRPKKRRDTAQKITPVTIVSDAGKAIARRVLPVYAGDILIDTFQSELSSSSGYIVSSVRKSPKKVPNAIDISLLSVQLDQNSGLLTTKGTCTLQIKVDIWRNGSKVDSHDYVSSVSDFSFSDPDKLFLDLMDLSAKDIAHRAEPDILHDIGAIRN